MIKFIDFLNESLDSRFEVNRDPNLEHAVSMTTKGKISNKHTAVMSSDHMKSKGLHVIRLKTLAGHVEYHLHNENSLPGKRVESPDTKSMIHSMKIIHDDVKDNYSGDTIHLQSPNSQHYSKFLSVAKKLAEKHGKQVKEIGETPLTSIPTKTAPTIQIN